MHSWYLYTDLVIVVERWLEIEPTEESLPGLLGTDCFHTVRHFQSRIDGEIWNVHVVWRGNV